MGKVLLTGCQTIGGRGMGKPCIFPFKYGRRTYTKCITFHSHVKPWCSTKVDREGRHINGNWGTCDENCPGNRKLTATLNRNRKYTRNSSNRQRNRPTYQIYGSSNHLDEKFRKN